MAQPASARATAGVRFFHADGLVCRTESQNEPLIALFDPDIEPPMRTQDFDLDPLVGAAKPQVGGPAADAKTGQVQTGHVLGQDRSDDPQAVVERLRL